MLSSRNVVKVFSLAVIGALFLALGVACSSSQTTSTPIPPATPAQASAPTAVPTTGAQATAVPTPTQVTAAPTSTPTRELPTATPVTSGPQYGGILRYAARSEYDTLDPAYAAVADIYEPAFALYDTLTTADQNGVLQPDLAKSWDISPDGTSITFHLNSGMKFQDGTPVNSDAIKWNFDRMLDPNNNSPRKAELGPYVKDVTVVDDTTLTIDLFKPYRPILPLLATDRPGFMVSPTAAQKYGDARDGGFGRNPVGSGPFMFKDWVPDQYLNLVRNPNYWQQGKPYLDGIQFLAVPQSATQLAMLQTGEADMIWETYVRAQDVPTMDANPALKTVEIQGAQTQGLLFNPSIAPFDNKDLRQAIAYAIDRQQYVNVVLAGAGEPAYTMSDSGWAHNPDLKPITYDPAMAKQKLAAAGYPNGVTIPFQCYGDTSWIPICEVYQAMLKNVGITANIVIGDPAHFWGPNGKEVAGVAATGWSHRADPDIRMRWIFYPGGFYNVGNYNNPQVTQLMDQAVATYDVAKAKPLYDQIQTITTQDAVWAYAAWITKYAAMRKSIQGYVPMTDIGERLQFLWFQK